MTTVDDIWAAVATDGAGSESLCGIRIGGVFYELAMVDDRLLVFTGGSARDYAMRTGTFVRVVQFVTRRNFLGFEGRRP